MMEREVPATGRVKQQAASRTAPQRLRWSEKICAATRRALSRKRKMDARWQINSNTGRDVNESSGARAWAKIEKRVGDKANTESDGKSPGSASALIPAT